MVSIQRNFLFFCGFHFINFVMGNEMKPHVTDIINNIFGSNPYWTELGRDKGTALHLAIKYSLAGKLNPSTIDHRIQSRLQAFEKFMIETGFKISHIELKLESKIYRFQGTPDALTEDFILIDWKSTIEPTVDLQLAAYSILIEENLKKKIKKAVAVELRDNGSYNCRWIKKDELKKSEKIFLSCLNIYNWKIQNNM